MYRGTLALFCIFVGVQSRLEFCNEKCNRDDKDCMLRLTNNFLQTAVKGDCSLGMENLDPMSQDYIEGKFLDIQYKLRDNTVVGFKNCNVINPNIALENNTISFKLICPTLLMFGNYEISGTLIAVPIDGNGEYNMNIYDYHIDVHTTTKIIQNDKGEKYLNFKNFKAQADLKGGMKADLKNLFNGENKELADAALTFLHGNAKPVSDLLQDPIVYANIIKIIKNLNKFLKVTPLNKYINY